MALREQSGQTDESETSPVGGESDGVVLRLWTRRPVCGPRTDVINRLGSLRAADAIADFEVETWPDELVVEETDTRVASVVDAFREWAATAGVTLEPAFDQRTVSPLVGRSREVLTLPMMAIAVYEDADLTAVYPHAEDGETRTVVDYLDGLD